MKAHLLSYAKSVYEIRVSIDAYDGCIELYTFLEHYPANFETVNQPEINYNIEILLDCCYQIKKPSRFIGNLQRIGKKSPLVPSMPAIGYILRRLLS